MKEKLLELLKNNPEIKAQFTSYYKYYFNFKCNELEFSIGGDSADIYRWGIDAEMLLSELINYLE